MTDAANMLAGRASTAVDNTTNVDLDHLGERAHQARQQARPHPAQSKCGPMRLSPPARARRPMRTASPGPTPVQDDDQLERESRGASSGCVRLPPMHPHGRVLDFPPTSIARTVQLDAEILAHLRCTGVWRCTRCYWRESCDPVRAHPGTDGLRACREPNHPAATMAAAAAAVRACG